VVKLLVTKGKVECPIAGVTMDVRDCKKSCSYFVKIVKDDESGCTYEECEFK
jgi:hypothetical protein